MMDTQLQSKRSFLIGYHHRLFADGIISIINEMNERISIDGVENGRKILDVLKSKKYDLLIVDLIYPGYDTIDYLREIKKRHKETKVLLISDLIQNGMTVDLLNTGIEGYILHSCSRIDLENALSKILREEKYICTSVTSQILCNIKEANQQSRSIFLTAREKEILGYLIKKHSNRNIAEELNISELTVKTHRKNLMKKFGSRDLLSLVRYACRENLINGDTDEFCNGCPHRHRYKFSFS